MGLVLRLSSGTAEVVESDGCHVVVASSVPSPPGSTLAGLSAASAGVFRVKVRSCRRVPGDAAHPYRIEGRFVDITKEQRALVRGDATIVTAPGGRA